MNRRHVISAGVLVLSVGFVGADIPSPKPPVSLAGPITVYRDNAPFDADGRHFVLWNNPVMMTEIHRQSVNEFIRRPGAGLSRLEPQFVPQEWVELVPESLGEGRTPSVGAKPQPPRYDALNETLALPDGSKRTVRERVWLLHDQRLMSVSAKSGPAVYVQDAKAQHELMREKTVATSKNTPTRKLDEFETAALVHIRDGNDVVLQSSAPEMRVLGAIRARAECLECHKTEAGSLLGAFSYTLTLQSNATPEADCLKETAGLSRTAVGAVHFVESLGGKVVRTPGGPISEVYFTHTWSQNAERLAKEPPRNGRHVPPYARLKNSALDVLESFSDLRVLDITHSMVTDNGLKEIAKLKTLRKLAISPGYVTDAGIAELKKALPDCAIEMKQPAFRAVMQ
jgi:hypothetical protein